MNSKKSSKKQKIVHNSSELSGKLEESSSQETPKKQENVHSEFHIRITSSKVHREHLHDYFIKKLKKGCYQLEAGKKSGQEHFQCAGLWKQRTRRSTVRKELEAICSGLMWPKVDYCEPMEKHLEVNAKYCMKSDTRIDGPWYINMEPPKWWRAQVDIPDVIAYEDLPKWAHEYIEKVEGRWPDKMDRSIDWIYSYAKGMYKTSFSKYMNYHHDFYQLDCSGCKRHILSQVYRNKAPGYVMTAPADALGYCYIAIELIKDMFFSSGFGTECNGMCHRKAPWVVVVVQRPPDEDAMIDRRRWNITCVDPSDKIDQYLEQKDEVQKKNEWEYTDDDLFNY